jgi:mRNA interferase YafQ
MLTIIRKSRFKKDFKKLQSSGRDLQKLAEVLHLLANEKELPERHRDHSLIGDYVDHRECHITPDWLLIYQTTGTELLLVRTGSHSELFG